MQKIFGILLTFLTFFCTSTVIADKTILAGGCFWCMESDFEKLKGVTNVVSGFSGGTTKIQATMGTTQATEKLLK